MKWSSKTNPHFYIKKNDMSTHIAYPNNIIHYFIHLNSTCINTQVTVCIIKEQTLKPFLCEIHNNEKDKITKYYSFQK